MKLTFLGATHEVTGSCYYLEACGKRILIDYGLEQGKDYFVNQPVPVSAGEIDMVLLTHAHIDHSGKLPLLAREGFGGQVFATEGTEALCEIMLQDSAHIQEFEAEWKNRKAQRAGKPAVEPLYTVEDAKEILRCFVGVPYNTEKIIADGITVRFVDAGHLLGSASIEVKITEDDVTKKLVFSGDIGNLDQPLIADPTYLTGADYVVMESTYGDRSHDRPTDYVPALASLLQKTFDRGGNVVIPSFAVGRTQEMLYFIREIKEKNLVEGHDGFEVWVDSPLAVEATEVFMKRMYADFDADAKALLAKGVNPIGFAGLRTAVSSEESKAINEDTMPKVIISASGMCDAGRIKHHLKHNLWRKESTVLFVGYQSEGTLGRTLMDGAKKVKLFGEEIDVAANVCMLPGISGHADKEGLMRWIRSFGDTPQRVFITHGEDRVCQIFRDRIREELGLCAYTPYSGTVVDLAANVLEVEAEPVPIRTAETAGKAEGTQAEVAAAEKEKALAEDTRPVSREYSELQGALQELIRLVASFAHKSSKEVKKLTREIHKLISRWEEK